MGELFSKLGIDWRLLIANLITFFIVLGLLAKFAFKPLMAVMERRRGVIDQSLKDAEAIKEERTALDHYKTETLKKAREEALHIVQGAKKDAEHVKQQIMAQASAEATDVMTRTKQALAEEQKSMLAEAKSQLADLVVTATGKLVEKDGKAFTSAMSKSATEALEEQA